MRFTPVLLVFLLLVGCGLGTPKPQPTVTLTPSIADVKVYKGLSHRHLQKGEYPHVYPQSPPVGGAHSPVWLKCGVYSQQVPKENAVHSLEHGGIWITYRPKVTVSKVDTVTVLTELAQTNREYVLVSPYSDQDAPVVATTWGLQLKVQSPDDPRLLEFIRTYAGGNQGDEKGVRCASTGATLDQALKFDASQK